MNKAINTVNARLPFKFFDQLVKEFRRSFQEANVATTGTVFFTNCLASFRKVRGKGTMIRAKLGSSSTLDLTADRTNVTTEFTGYLPVGLSSR